MATTKVCSRCRRSLSVDNFSPTPHTRSGLYAWCRECSRRHQREVYRTLDGQLKHRVRAARARAKRFNLDFALTLQDVLDLWEQQEGLCAISGMPLTIDNDDESGKQAWRPSLDRIVPEKGYVRGNVRLVTTMVNFGINKWGQDAFLTMCEAVTKNSKKKRKNKR